jgi:hypothetical protein
MDRTARHKKQGRQAVHKLNNSFHSQRCLPLGMMIHRQNSYAPCSQRGTARREAQGRRSGQQNKNTIVQTSGCYSSIYIYIYIYIYI